MKAAVYEQFGPPEVVSVREVTTPEPKPGQVRVRIKASDVSAADYRARSGDLPPGLGFMRPLAFGFFKRKAPVLGLDFAGVVDAVGAGVTRFAVGDRVFGTPGFSFGCHAEYVCVDAEAGIAPIPEGLGFEDAVALVFGGGTALYFFDHAAPSAGQSVLVNGASGAVGVAMVQYAHSLGAKVTAVTSGGNADLVRGLGASEVIDYATSDFAAGDRRYDFVIDCVGNVPFTRADQALAEKGVFFQVVGSLAEMTIGTFRMRRSGRTMVSGTGVPTAAILSRLAKLALAGQVRPVIDRRFALEDIVAAHRYVDTGRKRGVVVITMDQGALPQG